MKEKSDFNIEGQAEIAEHFGVTPEAVAVAETMFEKTARVTGYDKTFEQEVADSITEEDEEGLNMVRKLLRISELKQGTEPDIKESSRTIYKAALDGRQPVSEERPIVLERASIVSEYVKNLGYTAKNPEDILSRTLVVKRNKLFRGSVKEFGEDRFIAIKRDVFRKPQLRGILDHEFLHDHQHKLCESGLVEGATSYFEKDLAAKRGERPLPDGFSGYYLERAFVSRLVSVVGLRAVAEAYFGGDTSLIYDRFTQDDQLEIEQILQTFSDSQRSMNKARLKGYFATEVELWRINTLKLLALLKGNKILGKYENIEH